MSDNIRESPSSKRKESIEKGTRLSIISSQFNSSRLSLLNARQFGSLNLKPVLYLLDKNGNPISRQINLDSPHTKEAIDKIGIKTEDCFVK